MHIVFALLAICAIPAEPADVLVVCPRSLAASLHPWIAHRQAQGHRLVLVSSELSADGIRSVIRETAQSGALKYVVLVGDAEPAAAYDSRARARSTPTYRIQAKVNIHWGSEPQIATDNWYADLDDDQVPDVAIGRITADGPDELAQTVRKILAYETGADYGPWRRQINFVAGGGGFGVLVDAIVQMATRKLLTDGIPPAYNTSMTQANWQSPYCPDPRRFRDVTLARLNEGCLFWVYMGHGRQRSLDHVRVPGGAFPIMSIDDARKLQSTRGLPIALLLACYAGAFDQPADCLAEEMLRAPGGPVAVIGGSRVTMPYGMAVMSDALMDELFQQKRDTLGEVLLYAKRRMASDDQSTTNRQLLDAIAAALSPSADQLREERLEHVSLFNLIGDPMLVLGPPQQIDIETQPSVTAGERLTVSGRCSLAGRAVIELVCRRDHMKAALPARDQFIPTDEFLRSLQEAYRQANDLRWAWQTLAVDGGEFETSLAVPPEAHGTCYVRAFVEGLDGFALGATKVSVRRPRVETAAAEKPNAAGVR